MPTGQYVRKPGRTVTKKPILDRLLQFVLPEPMSGCWLWIGALNTSGYPVISVNLKCDYAHRLSYRLVFGAIPEDLDLDHKCRVPCCVNPWHLEPVTPRENTRRGLIGILKTKCINGHMFDEENTYIRKTPTGSGRMCKTCGRLNKKKAIKTNVRTEQTNTDTQQLV